MRSPLRIVHGWFIVQRHALSLLEKANQMSGREGVLIMKLRLSLQCAAIAVGCLVATPTPAYAQAITSFDPPGSIGTFPSSINDAGEITGSYGTSDGANHGFVRDASGTFTSFDAPGCTGTRPTSINPAGEITGLWSSDGRGSHGFVRDASGTFTASTCTPGLLATPIHRASTPAERSPGLPAFSSAFTMALFAMPAALSPASTHPGL